MRPVEKDPMRKYFKDASLLFRFFLSLPVRIYNGIDMISIPRNNISNVSNEEAMLIPQSTKKMRAKYSPVLRLTLSMSLDDSKKKTRVEPNARLLNTSVKLLKDSIPLVLMWNK